LQTKTDSAEARRTARHPWELVRQESGQIKDSTSGSSCSARYCELRPRTQRPQDIHDSAEFRFGVVINWGIL